MSEASWRNSPRAAQAAAVVDRTGSDRARATGRARNSPRCFRAVEDAQLEGALQSPEDALQFVRETVSAAIIGTCVRVWRRLRFWRSCRCWSLGCGPVRTKNPTPGRAENAAVVINAEALRGSGRDQRAGRFGSERLLHGSQGYGHAEGREADRSSTTISCCEPIKTGSEPIRWPPAR